MFTFFGQAFAELHPGPVDGSVLYLQNNHRSNDLARMKVTDF